MKKTIALLLAAMMLFALCACGAKEEAAPAGSEAEEAAQIVDYGTSELFTTEDMDGAIALITDQIGKWEGVELTGLRYAGDECNTKKNLDWLNSLDENAKYTQVAELLSDFHSPVEGGGAWEPDTEMKDYQWWLAREEGKGWQLVTFGY